MSWLAYDLERSKAARRLVFLRNALSGTASGIGDGDYTDDLNRAGFFNEKMAKIIEGSSRGKIVAIQADRIAALDMSVVCVIDLNDEANVDALGSDL